MNALLAALVCVAASAFGPSSKRLPSAPVRAAASGSPEMKVVNIGVIGAGRIGLVHLEALSCCET